MAATQTAAEEAPRAGDNVKLIGNHRYSGHTGVYLYDREFWGRTAPVVRLCIQGAMVRTMVLDPARQMKKA